MYQQILVPLDGSDNAQSALQEAIQISRYFGSTLTLMAVVDQGRVIVASGSIPYDLSGELTKQAQQVLEESKRQVEAAGVIATTVVESGSPKHEIVKYANEHDIELIVIGKSGADAINRLLLGSTTAYVVRNAKERVLVVDSEDSTDQ